MFNKKLLITQEIRVSEALRLLDETAEKVLFVVDENSRLMGALTDGDIRRYVLSGRGLEDSISAVYYKTPTFILEKEYSHDHIKTVLLKNKLPAVPILDENHRVIDIAFWSKIFSEEEPRRQKRKKMRVPVVIMAGGKGTRLDPFTRILPKPLIPIGDKPIIELIMDHFHEYGMHDFYVTLNHKSKMIKAYFEEFKVKYRITYIDEAKPLGTAGGLKYLPENVSGPIFVSNSDILIEEDYGKILEFHKDNKNEITIVASVKNYNVPYGVCEIENGGILKKIKEKPDFNFLVNTGMYIVNSSALSIIPEGELYHITHLIEDVQRNGQQVGVFPVRGKAWLDVGEWEKYKETLERFKL
jgi:dTDP-glucose pyrophosphorylase